MPNNSITTFESDIQSITSGDILHLDVDELTAENAVEAYAIVKHLADLIEVRRKQLRAKILADVDVIKRGSETKNGGTTTLIKGHKVSRRKQIKHYHNVDRVKELLTSKNLDNSEAFDEIRKVVSKTVVNPSKMEKLLEVGKCTQEDIESCHVEAWSLTIKASSQLAELLNNGNTDDKKQLVAFEAEKI